MGWEVKSMRAGKAQIAEAYVYLKGGEAFSSVPISNALNSASTHVDTDPRARASCCSTGASSINMVGAVERRGYTIVPLELYWKEGRAKLEIGLRRARSSTTSAPTRRTATGSATRADHEGHAPMNRRPPPRRPGPR